MLPLKYKRQLKLIVHIRKYKGLRKSVKDVNY